MENQSNKTCQNCKYFIKHYAKYNGYYYQVTGCGHCINNNLDLRESSKRFKRAFPCEYWEPEVLQKIERRNNIKENLIWMAQRLEEITQILKDDE